MTGRLTGTPIGGKDGRDIKRDWEASAMAMPQPLSEGDKEALRLSYVQRYATINIEMTRAQATEAVKNVKKKFSGQINVSCVAFFVYFYGFKPHSTGCIHASFPADDSISASRLRPEEENQNHGMRGLLLLF